MLKFFPLPALLERFARRRVVNVALFGNGLSLQEWPHLCASYWHHHLGFAVNIVDDPAEADVLAVHGPLTVGSWPFFERWMNSRSTHAQVMAVGAEVQTLEGKILDPQGHVSDYQVDAILPGHPPGPDLIKMSLESLMERGGHV